MFVGFSGAQVAEATRTPVLLASLVGGALDVRRSGSSGSPQFTEFYAHSLSF